MWRLALATRDPSAHLAYGVAVLVGVALILGVLLMCAMALGRFAVRETFVRIGNDLSLRLVAWMSTVGGMALLSWGLAVSTAAPEGA